MRYALEATTTDFGGRDQTALSPVEKTKVLRHLLRTFVVPPPPQEIAEQLEGLHNGVYFGWAKLQGEQVACHPGWTLLLSSPCYPIDPSARADEARRTTIHTSHKGPSCASTKRSLSEFMVTSGERISPRKNLARLAKVCFFARSVAPADTR